MTYSTTEKLAFLFGLLGNIVSFLVFLAPMPTFYRIYKRKSSEGFQSIPYVVALLSAMLLLYYDYLKTDAILIITINAIGIVIEVAYLVFYFTYAAKKQRKSTLNLLLLVTVVYGLSLAATIFLLNETKRVAAVGWICAVFNIAVFAAPLRASPAIKSFNQMSKVFRFADVLIGLNIMSGLALSSMRQVIRTKSVEFMPFDLSLFLTLCATMWFFYGLFTQDYYIALPNVMGFLFGITQMILYMVYRNAGKRHDDETSEAKANTNNVDDLEMKYMEMTKTVNHNRLYRSVST